MNEYVFHKRSTKYEIFFHLFSNTVILLGGISKTDVYKSTRDKTKTIEELKTALQVLIDNDIDMIICEFFRNVEEIEWAIELAKSYGKPVAATMAIGNTQLL